MKLGFLGLGNMGQAMAGTLLRAGHSVAVWNRTEGKTEQLKSLEGARVATSPADAARNADVVLSILADDRAVLSVALGEGREAEPEPLIGGLGQGAIHMSMSTISPALSKALAEAHGARAQRYVAAPVLGRPEAAEHGQLVLLVAGPDEAIEACAPLLLALGRRTHRLGFHPERANVVKLACNFVLAAQFEVFGEAYALAEAHGIAAPTMLEILKDSMLRPEPLASYGERIAESQFEPAGFRLSLGLKDVRLALEAAEAASVPLPFASLLHERFVVAMACGLEEKDWSAVGRILPHKRAA
jgi:3-hydroxyisobutyrate dehydrogenase-like beta-hydroxyacid dehydrogenase